MSAHFQSCVESWHLPKGKLVNGNGILISRSFPVFVAVTVTVTSEVSPVSPYLLHGMRYFSKAEISKLVDMAKTRYSIGPLLLRVVL
jgi:hypothetical protein